MTFAIHPTAVPPPKDPLAEALNGPVQACIKDSPLEKVRIRICFFFDGTGNNQANVEAGKRGDPAWWGSTASFANGESNISILEKVGWDKKSDDADFQKFIYTEGIGTEDGKRDDLVGMGLGKGSALRDTGIIGKVERGMDEAVSEIAGYAAGREIIHLHIDTFGFSRGAAAARFCVWKCLEDPGKTMRDRLMARGLTVGEIEIKVRFVGLYDTVASFGLPSDYGEKNTTELHLRSISRATTVVQLAAADEHRNKFNLTDIRSAGDKGRQYFLPGAHSDVGGGYARVEEEDGIVLCRMPIPPITNEFGYSESELEMIRAASDAVKREKLALMKAGWYAENELKESPFELTGKREMIVDSYKRIPLKLMAEYAKGEDIHFSETMKVDYVVVPNLEEAEKQIRKMITDGLCRSPTDWSRDDTPPEWLEKLRHRFLHFSSFYASSFYERLIDANEPDWSGGDPVRGSRRRIIHPG